MKKKPEENPGYEIARGEVIDAESESVQFVRFKRGWLAEDVARASTQISKHGKL